MVLTLHRNGREPSSVRAIVIDHVFSPNPLELVALVQIELRQCGLIPPIPLLSTAIAFLCIVGCSQRHGAFTGINFKVPVRSEKRCMGPIRLDPTALCGPVVCIPYWTVHAHCLVLWERYPFVFHVGVHSYWGLIHLKPEFRNQKPPTVK